jgi:hypothetical protein
MTDKTIQANVHHTISIRRTSNPENPRKHKPVSEFVSWNPTIGDNHRWDKDGFAVFKGNNPQHLYIPLHLNNSVLNTVGDGEQVGWILTRKNDLDYHYDGDVNVAKHAVKLELKEYNAFLAGNVWHFTIHDEHEYLVGISGDYYDTDECEKDAWATTQEIFTNLTANLGV